MSSGYILIKIFTGILFINDGLQELIRHFNASYTKKILVESISLLGVLWPYMVSGILATTIIKMYLSKEKVSGFFQKRNSSSILLASLIGVVSPMGSYMTIPLSAALFLIGTPLPVLMALLVSSPLINPNLFLLTAGAFGYDMAIARVISAFILGIIAGYITHWLMNLRFINSLTVINQDYNSKMSLNDKEFIRPDMKTFWNELVKMTRYISKYFFLAIILAAAIKILTPPNMMIRLFQGNIFMSVLFSAGAGVPFYVCGGASIPVVQQLADLGMSKGAVLAFFISGPLTKISNLVLIHAAFNTKIFLIYLLTGILGAVLFGLIFNII